MTDKITSLEKDFIFLNEQIKAKINAKIKARDVNEIFGLCEDAGFIKGVTSVLFYGEDRALARIEEIKEDLLTKTK